MTDLFDAATDFFALRAAARRAALGHWRGHDAAWFLADLEVQVLQLQRELRAGAYQPGPFRTFHIRDPKPRTISAAPFRDRVVHHALCVVMEVEFERFAVFDSYACRPGKGNRAAVWRTQHHARRWPWFAKLDVLHCFETIPIDRLLDRLSRRFDDARLLEAVEVVLRAGANADGLGLPIGNLTSQHFANFYLGAVDHFAQSELRVGAWCRYMDDMLLFGPDRATVRAHAEAISTFLEDALGLREKQAARRMAPVHTGVPVLGFRVWPQRIRLDGARRRRLLKKLRWLESANLPAGELQHRAGSLVAWAEHGDTRGLLASMTTVVRPV